MEFHSAHDHRAWLASQSALPRGFRVAAAPLSFIPTEVAKPARMTVTLIVPDTPTPDFAAVFTRNAFPGAPVVVGRRRLDSPRLGAIVVNNKISNVCAPDGVAAAERVCAEAARLLGIAADEVIPSSTGVIGWRLPVDAIRGALPGVVEALRDDSILPAAAGIVTTDLYPKIRRVDLGGGAIVGIAKGAGMIEPNLATMLVYILTDLQVPRDRLRLALRRAVGPTFNAISIDSDQSTSDTVVLVSSGRVSGVDPDAFDAGLYEVCNLLAADIVRNGEGVKHVVRCRIQGAPDTDTARRIGKSVINSPLMQCAICGNDPNVGRLVMAVGKCVGNDFPGMNTERCRMAIGGIDVFAGGVFRLNPTVETQLAAHLRAAELYETQPPDAAGVFRPPVTWPAHERCVDIDVDLGCGAAEFTVLGCDRTHEYISENADYRS